MRRRLQRIGTAALLSLAALARSGLASADPPRSPAPPPAPLPSAMVRISPPDPNITLERRIGSLDLSPAPRSVYADPEPRWERVCFSPCQALLPSIGEYRIAGHNITPSSTFSLSAPLLDLKVAPGSASARTAGIYMAILGFLIGTAGGILVTSVALSNANSEPGVGSSRAPPGLLIAGAVSAGVGGGVGIIGLGVALATGTSVNDVNGKSPPAYVGPAALLHATGQF